MPLYSYGKGGNPMKQIQINYGQGWENTVYKPMDGFTARTIMERLQSAYTNYSYRLVSAWLCTALKWTTSCHNRGTVSVPD